MNFPQIPTDNLYKFLALAGLIVSLVGFVAPEISDFELALREVELVKNLQVVTDSGQRLLDKISERKLFRDTRYKQIEELNELSSKLGCQPPGGADLCKQSLMLRAEYGEDVKAIDEYYDQIVKWKADTAKNEEAARILKYLQIKNDRFRDVCVIAMWGGLVITLCGFLFWYFLVQRFQDRELKRKAQISPIQRPTNDESTSS